MTFLASYRNTMAGARRIAVESVPAIEAMRHAPEPLPAQVTGPEPEALRLMRRRGMPLWARHIVVTVAIQRKVSVDDLVGRKRYRRVVAARNEAMYLIKAEKPVLSFPLIGKWFDRDHTSILFAVASHQEATGAPKLTAYNIAVARRRNAATEAVKRRREREAK